MNYLQTSNSSKWNLMYTEQLYSKERQTREQYAVSLNFNSQHLQFLLRKAKLELPLAETIDICLKKGKLAVNLETHYTDILYLGLLSEFSI